MRLFTAIKLPPETLPRLERLLALLRPEALVKWSPVDNLHITTKFIGEWPTERMGELTGALDEVAVAKPIALRLKGMGWFPNERSPRVLWVGVEADAGLRELAQRIDERLAPLSIPPEERDYSPHLTLARVKSPVPLERLRSLVRQHQATEFGEFTASRFTLFRSDPGSNASLYRPIQHFNFEARAAAAGLAR